MTTVFIGQPNRGNVVMTLNPMGGNAVADAPAIMNTRATGNTMIGAPSTGTVIMGSPTIVNVPSRRRNMRNTQYYQQGPGYIDYLKRGVQIGGIPCGFGKLFCLIVVGIMCTIFGMMSLSASSSFRMFGYGYNPVATVGIVLFVIGGSLQDYLYIIIMSNIFIGQPNRGNIVLTSSPMIGAGTPVLMNTQLTGSNVMLNAPMTNTVLMGAPTTGTVLMGAPATTGTILMGAPATGTVIMGAPTTGQVMIGAPSTGSVMMGNRPMMNILPRPGIQLENSQCKMILFMSLIIVGAIAVLYALVGMSMSYHFIIIDIVALIIGVCLMIIGCRFVRIEYKRYKNPGHIYQTNNDPNQLAVPSSDLRQPSPQLSNRSRQPSPQPLDNSANVNRYGGQAIGFESGSYNRPTSPTPATGFNMDYSNKPYSSPPPSYNPEWSQSPGYNPYYHQSSSSNDPGSTLLEKPPIT